MSVAEELARRVRERVPGWLEETDGPRFWKWTDPDDDYDRFVIVDGRPRELRVLPPMEGKHLGPSLIGFRSGITVRVDLRGSVDQTEVDDAMNAVAAVDALPAENADESSVPERLARIDHCWQEVLITLPGYPRWIGRVRSVTMAGDEATVELVSDGEFERRRAEMAEAVRVVGRDRRPT